MIILPKSGVLKPAVDNTKRASVTPTAPKGEGYQQGASSTRSGRPLACQRAGEREKEETPGRLLGEVLLTQQPAVDDVPFVSPPGLEIQEVGLVVLQLEKEFQRVP